MGHKRGHRFKPFEAERLCMGMGQSSKGSIRFSIPTEKIVTEQNWNGTIHGNRDIKPF